MSAFDNFRDKAYPFKYRAELRVGTLVGGIPADEKVAEGWLRTKLAASDDIIRKMVSETMIELGITADEATGIVNTQKNLCMFKRERCPMCLPTGPNCAEGGHPLYFEGRQIKAAIKEAASIAVAADKLVGGRSWGTTKKGLQGFLPEHVFVAEDHISMGITEPTGVRQTFLHVMTKAGKVAAINYNEYVEDVTLAFTVLADWEFTEEQWAAMWLTGEQNGLGAQRSQGNGRYTVTRWDRI